MVWQNVRWMWRGAQIMLLLIVIVRMWLLPQAGTDWLAPLKQTTQTIVSTVLQWKSNEKMSNFVSMNWERLQYTAKTMMKTVQVPASSPSVISNLQSTTDQNQKNVDEHAAQSNDEKNSP